TYNNVIYKQNEILEKYINKYNSYVLGEHKIDNLYQREYTQKELMQNIDIANYQILTKNSSTRVKLLLNDFRYNNTTNQWLHVRPNFVNGVKFNNYSL